MTFQARLLRLERKALSDNPLDALSADDLEEALAAVTRRIEAQTGMPIAALHGISRPTRRWRPRARLWPCLPLV